MTNQKDIFSYLVPGKCAHLAGIGGVSMSPLAEVLHGMGLKVQGSDMNDGPSVEHLRSLGIPVAIGHAADNLGECDFVIRTAAIHDDNPEISGAVTRGIPVFERAQAWGAIMKGYKNALCISGTHGKTTTTSMATHIFMAAQKDPTVMIGGTLQLLHSGYRVGKGDTIIAESCEYCNSFLSFFPTVAVILNVEADHLDFFKDLADVEHSFRRFAELVPIGGHVVANMDDQGARDALRGISQPIFWFSYDDPAAQCRAENVAWTDGLPSFDIYIRGSYYAHVSLRVGGKHNVMNALAAASAAYLLGVSGEAVGLGLATFTGAGRRFEYKGSFRTSTTITPIIPASCTRCSKWRRRCPTSASSAPSSPTPIRARRRCSTTLSRSFSCPMWSCWQRFSPRASRTPSAFPRWISAARSPALSTAPRLTRWPPRLRASPVRATSS